MKDKSLFYRSDRQLHCTRDEATDSYIDVVKITPAAMF